MKKGDVFEISVRRFFTSDEAPVITPESTFLMHVTDAAKFFEKSGEIICGIVDQIEAATAELPFSNIRQMTKDEINMLCDGEDGMESVAGMTRQ